MIWWFDIAFHKISQIVTAKWRWKDGSPTSMWTACCFFHLFNQRVFLTFFGTVAARTPLQRPHLKRFVACRHSPRHLPSNSDGQMGWWTMVSIFFVYPLWHLDEAPGPETSLWQDALEPTKIMDVSHHGAGVAWGLCIPPWWQRRQTALHGDDGDVFWDYALVRLHSPASTRYTGKITNRRLLKQSHQGLIYKCLFKVSPQKSFRKFVTVHAWSFEQICRRQW